MASLTGPEPNLPSQISDEMLPSPYDGLVTSRSIGGARYQVLGVRNMKDLFLVHIVVVIPIALRDGSAAWYQPRQNASSQVLLSRMAEMIKPTIE